MQHPDLRLLFPSLWLAVSVIAASWAALHSNGPAWLVLGAPLLVAFAVLSADVWQSHIQGWPARPSPVALILASTVVLTGLMIGWDDPRQAQAFMPVLAAVAATSTLRRRRARCTW